MMESSKTRVTLALVLFAGLVLSAGCVKKSKYEALEAKYTQALKGEIELEDTVATQQAKINAMESDFNALAEIFAAELAAQELELEQLVDGIEVAIPADVMYKSGAVTPTVGSDGLKYAKKLAKFLSDTDYFVSVVGHTDNQKIASALAKKYPTNWELAGARAAGATRFLVKNGVNPRNLVASSRGQFDPVASNNTPEGRAQNRRIQIVLRSLP